MGEWMGVKTKRVTKAGGQMDGQRDEKMDRNTEEQRDRKTDGWMERLEYVQMDRQQQVTHPRFCCIVKPYQLHLNCSSGIALVSISLGLQYSTVDFLHI